MDARFVVVFLSAIAVANAASGDYAYTGPKNDTAWPTLFGNYCNGSSQSPINIVTDDATEEDDGDRFDLTIGSLTGNGTIANTGHTFKFTPPANAGITVKKGGLPGDFTLLQLHFHWGDSSTKGSEHTVDGKAYPLEVHLVFTNDKYKGDSAQFLSKEDGLAVLGVFFKEGDESPGVKTLLTKISSVYNSNTNTTVDASGINLQQLLPKSTDKFYRYKGSLTTPTCNEVVTWTVFKDVLSVSSAQLAEFRKMNSVNGGKVTINYRVPQPLNGRKVTYYDLSFAPRSLVSMPLLSGLLVVALGFIRM